jgi:threonyl-tRNA synthetase
MIIPISDKYLEYAEEVCLALKSEGFRAKTNKRSDKVGAKIRQAELSKINVMLIVGEKELQDRTVSVRRRFEGDKGMQTLETVISELTEEVKDRRPSHSQES